MQIPHTDHGFIWSSIHSISQISRTARRIVDARAACGRAALLLGREPIFKATVETEYVSAMLPQYIVEDEESFGTFIDWL